MLPKSPARKLKRLKEPSSTKPALTGHELELLAAEFDRRSYDGTRNYTIAVGRRLPRGPSRSGYSFAGSGRGAADAGQI